jgi:hypothetical protein
VLVDCFHRTIRFLLTLLITDCNCTRSVTGVVLCPAQLFVSDTRSVSNHVQIPVRGT